MFAFQTVLAGTIAFYLAFFLQLEAPYWAGMTAWIVANPKPGVTISKGIYRGVGTLIGALMSLVLIGVFAQTPVLFFIALALWVGLCTAVSYLLHNFRSYAAVLAGYTTAIITMDSASAPSDVFSIAVARTTCILLGIASTMLVMAIFAKRETHDEMIAKFRAAKRKIFQQVQDALRCQTLVESRSLEQQFISEVMEMESLVEFAALESPDMRLRVNEAARFIAALLGFVVSADGLQRHLLAFRRKKAQPTAALTAILESTALVISESPVVPEPKALQAAAKKIVELRESLQTLEQSRSEEESSTPDHLIFYRIDELLAHLHDLLFPVEALQSKTHRHMPAPRIAYHTDYRASLIHGARAAIATAAAAAIWIFTAWPGGEGAVVMIIVLGSLFAVSPDPYKASKSFLAGIVWGAIGAFFCKFFLLNDVSGFLLFTIALNVFLFPAALAKANPKTAAIGASIAIYIISLVAPENMMSYDLAGFLNNVLILTCGAAIGAFSYLLIFPRDIDARRRAYRKVILRDLGKLAAKKRIDDTTAWQSLMFDRIRRCQTDVPAIDDWTEGSLTAIHVGMNILHLRAIATRLSQISSDDFFNPISQSLDALSQLATAPQSSLTTIRRAIAKLKNAVQTDPQTRHVVQLALGDLLGISGALETHAAFFKISK